MKIIRVEGCASCPHSELTDKHSYMFLGGLLYGWCKKTWRDLDIMWSLDPYYVHPDCPLEDEKEKR